ncbi:hypothetical protein DWX55_08375 [Collinsella sp. AF19-7AC]|uniref:hypothetical protein n=1 Tax=unclassified Collinsella TaxID=2637548 RepID=UPI000E4DB557|nr:MULTISPECIES: hypothetical protein [unclassified Collinsella]RGT02520.1 hypothetical protein DWX55_08375 [Collinsella sp. AF19-7AC]RGT29208.1 hypothetical protein DWX39_08465 [Collinsella sp. AF19-1LB]
MRTAKRILAEFMTVVMVLQACSPTVVAVAAGWQNISNEIAAASAKALDTAEGGETNGDVTIGSGSSDTGADSDSAGDDAAKDDAAAGDTTDSAMGSDSTGDQTEGDDAADDAAADDAEQDADDATSEDAEAQAGATITDLKKLVELLKANGAENIVLKEDNSGIKSLNVKSSEAFAALSNADASLYYDAQIKVIITGDAKLTESANNGMSFQGFGSDEHPFEGRIYRSLNGADSPVELTTDRTVFNSLKLTDQNNMVKMKWVGATSYSAPMVASKVSGAENSEESKTLNASVDIAGPVDKKDDTTSVLTAPLLGETTGYLAAKVTYSFTGSHKILKVNATGNIGLIGNTVESGALTVESVTFPNDLASGGTVETSSDNAGLLVGEVKDGATLSVGTLTNVPAATVQSTSGFAGGVVGLVGSSAGAMVNVTEALDLHALTVKGTTASGGFIGKAANLTLTVGTDNSGKDASGNAITIKPARAVGSSSAGTYAGGLIGDASFAGKFTINGDIFDFGEGVDLSVSNTSVAPSAGGLFGELDISNGDVTVSGGSYTSTLQNGTDNNNSVRGNYGGLVGKLWGRKDGEALRAFTVQDGAAVSFGVGSNGKLTYAGGLVGYLGEGNGSPNESAVVIDDATVTCATSGYASNSGKYGGAVGVVDTKNVLEVRGLKVETAGNATIGGSNGGFAGVVGSSWRGIVKFSGVTDLSDARFAENDHTAQLVYENFNSLIFAAGSGSDGGATAGDITKWQYKRPTTQVKIDDIYSYGQVIRLGSGLSNDLITINDSHQCIFKSNLVKTGGAFVLAGVDDFAKLAITWQTSGYFSAVEDVADDNFAQIPSTNITLSADINLSGTGLTGLTKDRQPKEQAGVNENNHSFTATLNGNGHTISLAVGEPYGMRGNSEVSATSDGNGKIYRHGRLGLFAAINGATVSDVTIAGSMKFDNGAAIDAGSLAGTIAGGLTLSGATCKTNIACDDTFANDVNINDVNIGGIAGSVSTASTVTFGGSSKAQATIAATKTLNGNIRIGGAIGYVGDYASTFNVTGLEAGGKIETGNCASGKIAQVGGLIGCIAQGKQENVTNKTNVATVNIAGLVFDSFAMSVGKNGDKLNGAGGLLGYSWGNAVVTIGDNSVNKDVNSYALRTTKASITAENSKELGGLVYAASGHWVINDYAIDLSGATINASNAEMLGLLVGRGSRVADGIYGSEPYAGLYLEDKAYWGTAYRVEGIHVAEAKSIKKFDEWVGDGRKPGSKLIDAEWNTVVSLHTKDDVNNGKLDMSGNPGSDNSYHNRTDFGNSRKTNAWTRYYYNLDKAYTVVGSNSKNSSASSWMDRPEYLLLWCACLYAPPAIQGYIIPGNREIFKGNNIGTNGSEGVAINLEGYSFYPTNPTSNSTVTVKNATITFHYSDIKAEQEGNKKNNEATQHENMHCALIRTHTGDLKVENVTLAGTVGSVVSDWGSSSGALVCRYIYGPVKKTNVAQITINGLVLDGLAVDGVTNATQYAPLLINQMQTLVNLDAKNISVTDSYNNGTKKKIAATSLFGELGVGDKANQVIAKFEKISLPSQTDNSIFTHASLLESFGYATGGTGSADYTFTADAAQNDKVTYGSEIDRKGTEYSGKQLWYYDEATYGTPNGLVKAGDKTANVDAPVFGDYLPYVYKGKATESNVQYHEIKVNQRIPKLITGCGTYGDPYTVKDATEMNAIANYINNSVALDGWEVTIAADQSALCTRRSDQSTNNEVTYVYKQANGTDKKWERKIGDKTDPEQTLSDETVRRYIQSAYYSIEPDKDSKITVDAASFGGFGNKANPFRGVIVGDLGASTATIEIENNKGELRGLVPYSYGSVVRNLNINYVNESAAITYSAKDADGAPTAFFGGVIGCILGGDNIIDGVVVNGATADNPTTGFTVTGGGTKSHLVPVGGYVGAIAGGGVIFRNMSGTSWRAGTSDKSQGLGTGNFRQYDNPYVGRVIDGYAFSEGCKVENGNASYKINELTNKGTACVTTTGTDNKYIGTDAEAPVTTVENAQGLLVLSAIISSGAGAGAAHTDYANYGVFRGSKAYWGSDKQDPAINGYLFGNKEYGKVRNASYDCVGKPASAAGDFETAKNDDQKAPGKQGWHGPLDHDDDVNSPYLVASYAADYQTGYVCASKSIGMSLEFKENATYDMTGYGTGYVGLSGRYYSNACSSNEASTDRDRITPHVATIDGNGATITVGAKDATYGVVEYADDDYKVSGVGGLFSTVMFTSTNVGQSVTANDGAQVKDLTFSNCNVSLTYKDANGSIASGPASNDLIGTGLLAGATANYDGNTRGVYRNVQMKNCTVLGAKSVGGLLGSSGRTSRRTDNDVTYMVNFGSGTQAPANLYDCSYTGLSVTGEKYVGGYVGAIASPCSVWTTAATGVYEKTIGKNSTITATGTTPYVGGVFGYTSSNVSVNTKIGITEAVASSTAVISGVNVLATGSNTDKYMGAGGVVGSAYRGVISISNVRIDAGGDAKSAIIGDATGTNNSIRNAGGLIGEVTSSGSPNTYWFEDCSVENINIAGTDQCSGGLIGYYFSNVNIACNNIAIECATIKGRWSGGLLGAINSGADVINVTNTKVSNTTFGGTSNGGIAGDGRGQFHLVNVLMDSNTYKLGSKQGVLLGEVDTNGYSLSAAGVNVKLGNGKTTRDLPPMVYTTNTAAVNRKTYIAFGDYKDTLRAPDEGTTLYGADDTATTAASPYVTTSPVSTLAVRASDNDTTDRYLFGDGATIDTAATVQSEAGTGVADRYTYTNIGGINDNGAYQNKSSYDASSVASKFNSNNDTSSNQATTDFSVLVISGNDNTTVKSYLNIVTNGGFSDACRLNNENGTNPHVTAKAEVFQLKDGVFVKDDDASNNPTLRVVNNGKNNMSFSPSSDWDNGKGRFTLLTVTFTEAGQSYNVQVPIIVKRKLEIDFTATYDYGTKFKESDYANLGKDAHVLTSFGEPMTGLLTWTYNSANGKEVDFGWDSYMAAGGSMKGLGKSILFNGADGRLPQGSQLALIDANVDGRAGGREYHYTVGEGGATSVSLSGNDGFKDSAGNPYQERWLSEILDVSATQDGAGTWTVCDNEAEATAKAKLDGKWTLFKVAGADVPSNSRYTLEVPKDNGKEQRASESVYLVVNVPKSGDGVTQANINGFTASSIDSNSSGARISWNLHHVLRTDGSDDIQNSTASTYSILSNYEQNVVDKKDGACIPVSKSEDGAAYVLSLDVMDTVTFSPSQYYTESDHLFYQLDTSLCRYGANNNLMGVSSFPSGTSAIAKFYVAIGNQNYRWNGSDWEPYDASTPAFTQIVTDTGDDSLRLTLDHDLAGIRKRAAGGSFTVRTVVEEIRLTPDGCNKVISLSKQSGEDACTKMSYTAKLSTRDSGLATSSLAMTKRGNVGYYRMDTGDTTITLSAPEKSQLGINVDDLRPIANGTIGLGATYELGGLSNAAEAIANADSVVYTLALQRRGTDGTYESVTDDISNYVTVTESKLAAVAPSGSTITFTDSKENGKFRTQNGDTTFNLPFTVKVNTQAEQRDQFYANYRLVMTASLVTGSTASATPQSPDYVTYTLTRVNLNGIDH